MEKDSQTVGHTPGPWTYHKLGGWYVIDPDIALSGNVPYRSIQEEQANARLIAAAPELLEALERVKETLIELQNCSAYTVYQEVMPYVEAAISEAKGIRS